MWEIQGETGKQFGDTRRAASEVAADVSLRFESLQPDRVSWSVSGQLSDLSDLAIPEVGEELQIYREGVRKFRGIVTQAPATIAGGNIGVQVEAEGAHWWLEKQPLTEVVRDVENNAQERGVLVFRKGQIEASFRRLFNRAQAVGLPVKIGTLSTCYEVPQMTVSDGSFADALAELVRMVPDAVTWWDYSGDVPAFNLARRGDAEVLELTYGERPFQEATFQPVLGLETEEVVVQYSQRGIDGLTRYLEQRVGSAPVSKRQVVVTSGPELADILPPDPVEVLTLSTTQIYNASNSFILDAVNDFWPFWVELEKRYATELFSEGITQPRWHGPDADSARYSDGRAPNYYLDDGTKVDALTNEHDYVIATPLSDLPRWLGEVLPCKKLTLSGTFFVTFTTPVAAIFPEWIRFMIAESNYQSTLTSGGDITLWLFFDVEVPVAAVTAPLTNTEVGQPLGYQFSTPPDGFAENLRAAQGFVPYEGQVTLTEQDAGGDQALGRVVNIAGALPDWAGMRALVQGVDINLATGSQTVRCGAPQRVALQDIVNRLRVDPRDNVETL